MISTIIEELFSFKFNPIWVSKKRNDEGSMIFYTPKSSQKISEVVGVSLWLTSTPDLKPIDNALGDVLEN